MKDLLERAIGDATGRVELWVRIFTEMRARNLCEVGVYKGDFAKVVLAECTSIEKYYMIDPWKNLVDWNKPANRSSGEFDAIYDEAIAKTTSPRAGAWCCVAGRPKPRRG